MVRSIRRVLVVHPYGIGDLLFVTPILRALRLQPTVERVDLLLGSRTKEMIESNPHIDDIYVIDKDKAHAQTRSENFKEMYGLGKQLKSKQYDLLIDFSLRREYAFWSMVYLGIPNRLGLNYKNRGIFHTKRLEMPNGFEKRHVVDYYAELVESAGIPVENRHLELYLPGLAIHEASNALSKARIQASDRLWVVAPGGGESWGKDAHLKRWPIKAFAQTLNQLASTTKIDRVLVIGSPKEKELADELIEQVSVPCVNFAGQVSLMASASLIEQSDALIANDGGLVHIAHALRKPVVALYGPADPVVYGPKPQSDKALAIYQPENCQGGGPCYQKFRYRQDCKCLEKIEPEYVLQKIKEQNFLSHVNVASEVTE